MTEEQEKLLSSKIVIEIQKYLSNDNLSDLQKILLINIQTNNLINTLQYEKYLQFSKVNQTETK